MNILEKDIEEIIYNTDTRSLSSRGLYLSGNRYRQLRIGNYGVADIVTIDRVSLSKDFIISVYELKKEWIEHYTFWQSIRYLKGIQRYFEKRDFDPELYVYRVFYKIILIGKSLKTSSDFVYATYLLTGNMTLDFYTYSYKWDGISFNHQHSYKLINEGF